MDSKKKKEALRFLFVGERNQLGGNEAGKGMQEQSLCPDREQSAGPGKPASTRVVVSLKSKSLSKMDNNLRHTVI